MRHHDKDHWCIYLNAILARTEKMLENPECSGNISCALLDFKGEIHRYAIDNLRLIWTPSFGFRPYDLQIYNEN